MWSILTAIDSWPAAEDFLQLDFELGPGEADERCSGSSSRKSGSSASHASRTPGAKSRDSAHTLGSRNPPCKL